MEDFELMVLLDCVEGWDRVTGRRPVRRVQGEGHSLLGFKGWTPLSFPSAEPTTTTAELVVIVGYNRASPDAESAMLSAACARRLFTI